MTLKPLVATFILGAASMTAGVQMSGTTTDLKDNSVATVTTIANESNLRIDTKSEENNGSIIVRLKGADDYEIIMLDKVRNEYRLLDKAKMQELQNQVEGALSQMEQAMKTMTPEQRAMLEKVMKGRMGQMPQGQEKPAELTFEKQGASEVNGFACTNYVARQGERKVAEVCAAEYATLGVAEVDLSAFERMKVVFEDMAKLARRSPLGGALRLSLPATQVEGVPVRHVVFSDGEPTSRFELTESKGGNFTDKDFSVGDAQLVDFQVPHGNRP